MQQDGQENGLTICPNFIRPAADITVLGSIRNGQQTGIQRRLTIWAEGAELKHNPWCGTLARQLICPGDRKPILNILRATNDGEWLAKYLIQVLRLRGKHICTE